MATIIVLQKSTVVRMYASSKKYLNYLAWRMVYNLLYIIRRQCPFLVTELIRNGLELVTVPSRALKESLVISTIFKFRSPRLHGSLFPTFLDSSHGQHKPLA